MIRPPEPPPEGVLIESARTRAKLSVREAARRAGISEGWWRQVAKGYQSMAGGSFGLVRAPAETVTVMARVVGVTPEQMEAEGKRPDAAEVMREEPVSGSSILEAARVLDLPIADIIERLERRVREAERLLPPGVLPPGIMIYPEGGWQAEKWDELAASTYADDQPMTAQVLITAMATWEGRARQRAEQGDTAAGLMRPLARA